MIFFKHVCLANERQDLLEKAVRSYEKNCIGENASQG